MATALTNRLIAHNAVLGSPVTRDGALLAFHDAFFVASLFPVLAFFAAFLINDKVALRAGRKRESPAPAEAAFLDASVADGES